MNHRALPVIFALLCSAGAFPADADPQEETQDSKTSLERQRANYRQNVAQYGAQSPQARVAKQNLRVVRRQYFSQRRKVARAPRPAGIR